MTLIIAAQGKDFVVVGADTREVIRAGGIRVEINLATKLVEVSPHVAVLTAGDAGHSQWLVEKYKKDVRKRKDGVSVVAEDFGEFLKRQAKKDANVPKHPEHFPDYRYVVSGLDKVGEKFALPKCYSLYSVEGFKVKVWQEGFVLEGKPMLGYYLFERYYPKMKKPDELCGLVGQTLYDTSRVDGDVGFHFRMAVVRDNGFSWFDEREIRNNFIADQW